MAPYHIGTDADGPARALLFALSGVAPPLCDVYWSIIQEAPALFGLRDIARLLVMDAEAACGRGEPVRGVEHVLEQRIKNLSFCLNDDDAADFRQCLIAEMDARCRPQPG